VARQQFRTQCPHSSWKVLHVSALTKTTRNEFSTFPARKHSNMNRLVIMRDAIRTQTLFVAVFRKTTAIYPVPRSSGNRRWTTVDRRARVGSRFCVLRFSIESRIVNIPGTFALIRFFDIILSHNAFRLLTKTFVLVKFRRVPHYYTHLFHIYTPVII